MATIAADIEAAVLAWPGVSVGPHRFGGREFRVRHHEIGHLHSSHLADLPFPRRMREELVAAGRAERHHVLPETGWVSKYIRSADDVPDVIALFRLNYDRLMAAAPGSGDDEAGA
ncbi:MAG: DUF5519 family protein [Gemmatimonadaceae bacterium]|jgi:hypothetical protein|nr:DUF5519 family protein [Gemmatimonadaceae bacterium]